MAILPLVDDHLYFILLLLIFSTWALLDFESLVGYVHSNQSLGCFSFDSLAYRVRKEKKTKNMQLPLLQLVLSLIFASSGLTALLSPRAGSDRLNRMLKPRAPSPDNKCGKDNKGYTCDPSAPNGGGCCSQSGYCGESWKQPRGGEAWERVTDDMGLQETPSTIAASAVKSDTACAPAPRPFG